MPAGGTRTSPLQAIGYAPCHVTGFFTPDLSARDPRGRGSVGAGIVLDLGVRATARWQPARRSSVRVHSDVGGPVPISRDVARRLLAARPGSLHLRLEHALPIGQGFGTSAAGALATALAVGALVGMTRQRCVETAHLADLFGGGGLGGVASILGGGFEVRQRPGVPPIGRVRHRPFPGTLLVSVIGGALPSPPLLRSAEFLDTVREAGRSSLERISRSPTIPTFLAESERFTDRLPIASLGLRRTIAELRAVGASTAQAMFGQSLFAVAPSGVVRRRALRVLERRKLPGLEIAAASRGANIQRLPNAYPPAAP